MSWSRLLSTGNQFRYFNGGPPRPRSVAMRPTRGFGRCSVQVAAEFLERTPLIRTSLRPIEGTTAMRWSTRRRRPSWPPGRPPGAAGPAAAGPGALVDPNRSGSHAARGSWTRANSARRRSARSRRRAWRSPVLPSGGRRSSGRPVREGGRRTTRRSPTEATEDPKCAGSSVQWPAGVQGRPGLRPEEEGTAAEAVPEQGTGEDTGGWCILGPTPILGKGYRARFGRAEPERAEPRGPQ